MRLHDKHFLYVHQIENHHDFFPTTLKRQFKKSLGNLFFILWFMSCFFKHFKKVLTLYAKQRRKHGHKRINGVDKLWCCLPYFFATRKKYGTHLTINLLRNKKTQGGYQFSAWSLHVVMDTSSDNSILVS